MDIHRLDDYIHYVHKDVFILYIHCVKCMLTNDIYILKINKKSLHPRLSRLKVVKTLNEFKIILIHDTRGYTTLIDTTWLLFQLNIKQCVSSTRVKF